MQPGDTVYYYIENLINGKFIPRLIEAEVIDKSSSENRIVVKNKDYGFKVFNYSDIGTRLLTQKQKMFI